MQMETNSFICIKFKNFIRYKIVIFYNFNSYNIRYANKINRVSWFLNLS